MERGLRRLTNPVDDWCNISLDDIIIDRVLLPITFSEKLIWNNEDNRSNETSVSK